MPRAKDSVARRLAHDMVQAGFVKDGKPSPRLLAQAIVGKGAGPSSRELEDWRRQIYRGLNYTDGKKGFTWTTAGVVGRVLRTNPARYVSKRSDPLQLKLREQARLRQQLREVDEAIRRLREG